MNVFIIRIYPNFKISEGWINALNLAFKTEEIAREYCKKLEEIEYFWAYTIQPLKLVEE